MGVQLLGGQGALEQALYRGGDELRFALSHGVERGKALVLPLAGGHRPLVEQEFPGAQHGGWSAGEGLHVGG